MRHLRLRACGSTNDEARLAFERGEEPPLLISAEEQTAGRGRQGRAWSHLPGNFAGSFLLGAASVLKAHPGILSLLAGLAVREAASALGADPRTLRLKWPNDVLKDERKVAGILCELVRTGPREAFVVGIGADLAAAPAEADTLFPATALFPVSPPPPATFGDRLGAELAALRQTAENEGPQEIIRRWEACAWRLGEPYAVRDGDVTREGIFEGLDREGHLLLRTPHGTLLRIVAGDAVRR